MSVQERLQFAEDLRASTSGVLSGPAGGVSPVSPVQSPLIHLVGTESALLRRPCPGGYPCGGVLTVRGVIELTREEIFQLTALSSCAG